MPDSTSTFLKKALIWLLLLAIVDSAVLYLSDMAIEVEEVELVESEKGESEKNEKETENETDEEDSKISSPGFYNKPFDELSFVSYIDRSPFHMHHLEICSPPPERG